MTDLFYEMFQPLIDEINEYLNNDEYLKIIKDLQRPSETQSFYHSLGRDSEVYYRELYESVNKIPKAPKSAWEYINKLLIEKNIIKDSDVYLSAQIDRRHWNKVKNKNIKPEREFFIRLAFGLKLTLTETYHMMSTFGFALVEEKSQSDKILVFFLNKQNYNIDLVDDMLDQFGLPVYFTLQ